jgi:hypothetical protein
VLAMRKNTIPILGILVVRGQPTLPDDDRLTKD